MLNLRKIDGCANNPDNCSATKIGEHIPCGYLMSTIWVFDRTEKKHTTEKIVWKSFLNF